MARESFRALLPIWCSKLQWLADVRIPAPPHHQESLVPTAHSFQRLAEVWEQNDVAVAVAQQVVPRQFLRLREDVIEPLTPKLVALDVRLVAQPELASCLRRTRIIAKQNHLYIRV
jgi:hypothetical protein